jgi:hypothetical protein
MEEERMKGEIVLLSLMLLGLIVFAVIFAVILITMPLEKLIFILLILVAIAILCFAFFGVSGMRKIGASFIGMLAPLTVGGAILTATCLGLYVQVRCSGILLEDSVVMSRLPDNNFNGGMNVVAEGVSVLLKYRVTFKDNYKLELFITETGNGRLEVWSCSNDWNESTVTWRNAPKGENLLASVEVIKGKNIRMQISVGKLEGGICSFRLEYYGEDFLEFGSKERGDSPRLICYGS